MIKKFAAIVLAAGKGTRLAAGEPSPQPKVLFKLAGRPMISYTLEVLKKIGLEEIIIVVGYKANKVKQILGEGYKFATQEEQLGTGHAVQIGLSKASPLAKNILVVNGDDSAFYESETIRQVLNKHIGKGNTITFVSLEVENPTGLGRVVRRGKKVVAVVEEKVASAAEKKIKEVNDGVYVFRRSWLEENLSKIKKSSVGEYYLVDLIGLAVSQGEKVETFKLSDSSQWQGVNTLPELVYADRLMKERLKHAGKK